MRAGRGHPGDVWGQEVPEGHLAVWGCPQGWWPELGTPWGPTGLGDTSSGHHSHGHQPWGCVTAVATSPWSPALGTRHHRGHQLQGCVTTAGTSSRYISVWPPPPGTPALGTLLAVGTSFSDASAPWGAAARTCHHLQGHLTMVTSSGDISLWPPQPGPTPRPPASETRHQH